MSGIDGIGDAVTGGIIARAVEPKAGEKVGQDGHTHESNCLNCGTPLVGDFCHGCGQHAHIHRTLSAFGHDFLHGVLHFEGKIWRTLPLLAWRPGALTRRYIDGERARFVSPLALFLFSVFLMFGAISALGGMHVNNFGTGTDVATSLKEARVRSDAQVAELTQERVGATDLEEQQKIDTRLAAAKEESAQLKKLEDVGIPQTIADDNDLNMRSDLPWLNEAIQKAKKNPDLMLYKLQSSSYKFAWALIPISVPFLWLLFPFSRRFRLYDHSVFVTYSLSFMMLLAAALSLWNAANLPGVVAAALIVPPFHMYRQLKGTYGLSRFGALWRLLLLMMFAGLAISLFAVLVVALGVTG